MSEQPSDRSTSGALKELLLALLLVNVFVAVAGFLVGRRLDHVRTGVLVYVAIGALASLVVLITFAANVIVAGLAARWRRHFGND